MKHHPLLVAESGSIIHEKKEGANTLSEHAHELIAVPQTRIRRDEHLYHFYSSFRAGVMLIKETQ